MKVLKFGGTSMATAHSIKKVAEIIKKEKNCVVVVSAPGKRYPEDEKITDILFDCYKVYLQYGRCDARFRDVINRVESICDQLKVKGLTPLLTDIKNEINGGKSIGYTVSRGEYISAKILAEYLGVEFVDSIGLIKFTLNGEVDYATTKMRINSRLRGLGTCVVPGFYGVKPNGIIHTFDRGGSDITGSLLAWGLDAEIYENWTDIDGFYFCNPNFCKLIKIIPKLSYKEMKMLSTMGANVLHFDSIKPLENAGISVVIKNTFNPKSEGSIISNECSNFVVTGVALKENMLLWGGEKSQQELLLQLLNQKNIQYFQAYINTQLGIISADFDEDEKCEIIESYTSLKCSYISIITVVGENIKKSALDVLKQIINCVQDIEFLIYDGQLSILIGVSKIVAKDVYDKICKTLDYQ